MGSGSTYPCNFEDRVARDICTYIEEKTADPSFPVRIDVDIGTTRTDFGDPANPARKFIDADGEFTENGSDGLKSAQEYYQAAMRLGEIAAGSLPVEKMILSPIIGSSGGWQMRYFGFLRDAGVRIFWLPTDPLVHFFDEGLAPVDAMRFYLKSAQEIWDSTAQISDILGRRALFAKRLFDRMLSSRENGGFGIRHFDPSAEKFSKVDHPIYSFTLDCIGSWLYGMLCERYEIEAVPVQRFANDSGKAVDHVLVGLRLGRGDGKLTLVSFQPGEAGFDIDLTGKGAWAPISKIELLAYIHLNRAFCLYPEDRGIQFEELQRALRYAPHNHLVHYQLGLWYSLDGRPDEARMHLLKTKELNPAYGKADEALEVLSKMRDSR